MRNTVLDVIAELDLELGGAELVDARVQVAMQRERKAPQLAPSYAVHASEWAAHSFLERGALRAKQRRESRGDARPADIRAGVRPTCADELAGEARSARCAAAAEQLDEKRAQRGVASAKRSVTRDRRRLGTQQFAEFHLFRVEGD